MPSGRNPASTEEFLQAAHEEQGTDEQYERERDLRDDEGAPEAKALTPGGEASSASAHHRRGCETRRT